MTAARRQFRSGTPDGGAAVVEFVLVGAFVLIPLFLAIVQLALVLHARNIVIASAAVGARYGASADSDAAAGAAQTCRRIHTTLPAVRRSLACSGGYVTGGSGTDPVQLVEVRVDGPVPMFFLPWGSVHISAKGHAVREVAP
ncbi:MAG: TadE family protein [Actinomycetota bacterium]